MISMGFYKFFANNVTSVCLFAIWFSLFSFFSLFAHLWFGVLELQSEKTSWGFLYSLPLYSRNLMLDDLIFGLSG